MGTKNILLLTSLLAYSFVSNATNALTTQMILNRMLLNSHIIQEEQADGRWHLTLYKKAPIGFYEQIVQSKKKCWRTSGIGLAVCLCSFLGAKLTQGSLLEVPFALGVVGGFGAAVVAPLCVGLHCLQIRGFEKDFVPTDSQGNKIIEKYEYYKAITASFSTMPVPIMPTNATIYYAKAQV